ncbi:hypothetical protein DL770_006932 [Monosporascus sp. CRB-9-2]|nr:hypothetical protein DL770_006932 [Monosporascus sp. CRB-9-2]
MLRFIQKYLTFALNATPAVQTAAGLNATDTLKASQLATSPMASATPTAKSSLGLSYETVESKAELNVTVTCDDATLHTSLGHKLLRTRFRKKKGGHSKSDGGDENSSVCEEEESTDHLSTAAIAGIGVGCIVGATIMATAIAIAVHLWRGDKSSVDVEKASGDASTTTQVRADMSQIDSPAFDSYGSDSWLFLGLEAPVQHMAFAKSFTTLLLATSVVQAAGAFNSTDSVGISQNDASPAIVSLVPSESTLGRSPDITTASTIPYSASAGQYNVTITCNGDAPESYKIRSFGGKTSGHLKHKGGDDGEEDDEEEEDSLCQEPTASPQLSTAVIAAIVVGCVLGTAILVAVIALIIIVVRRRNRPHAAVKKSQFDVTAVSTSSLETSGRGPNGIVI